MAGFTTTSDGGWSFSFKDPKPVYDDTKLDMGHPYLADPERWKNYSDEDLYNTEVLLREFLETKRHGWGTPNSSARKFTAKMMYEILYKKKDGYTPAMARKMNRLLNHYATRVWGKKGTTIYGKMYSGKVYMLNACRLDKPPYSLALRVEWMAERGELPTWSNMALSEKLEAGESRTAKNARYRAKKVKYERRAKRARNDELYGDRSGEVQA